MENLIKEKKIVEEVVMLIVCCVYDKLLYPRDNVIISIMFRAINLFFWRIKFIFSFFFSKIDLNFSFIGIKINLIKGIFKNGVIIKLNLRESYLINNKMMYYIKRKLEKNINNKQGFYNDKENK